MTRRQGPTKKLIPALGFENRCPHTYSEDDGLQLDIECGSCQGAQDIDNRKCVSGILNVMLAGAVPQSIVLKRFVHKRYRGTAVQRVSKLARTLGAVNRAISSSEPPSDRKCRTCPASTQSVLESFKRALLEDPGSYTAEMVRLDPSSMATGARAACPKAERCLHEALGSCSALQGGD